MRRRASTSASPVVHIPAVSTGGTRLLIAAGEAVAGLEELPPLVRRLVETASEILVVSPVLVGRLRWLASDTTDRARNEADERLGVVLGHVQDLVPGAEASARVGDETPLTALEDAVRAFRPDRILSPARACRNVPRGSGYGLANEDLQPRERRVGSHA